jgi:hypothetical protein
MSVYVLCYEYDDRIENIGVFSSAEEIIKYMKNELVKDCINVINTVIKDINEDYNEKSKVKFNEYWTYQTRFVGNINWLINYLKTNKYTAEETDEWDSTHYSYYPDVHIGNYFYQSTDLNTTFNKDNFAMIKDLIPQEELDNINDLNNYPDLKQQIEEVINNQDIMSHYEAQCKRRDDTKKQKECGLNVGKWVGGTSM